MPTRRHWLSLQSDLHIEHYILFSAMPTDQMVSVSMPILLGLIPVRKLTKCPSLFQLLLLSLNLNSWPRATQAPHAEPAIRIVYWVLCIISSAMPVDQAVPVSMPALQDRTSAQKLMDPLLSTSC